MPSKHKAPTTILFLPMKLNACLFRKRKMFDFFHPAIDTMIAQNFKAEAFKRGVKINIRKH